MRRIARWFTTTAAILVAAPATAQQPLISFSYQSTGLAGQQGLYQFGPDWHMDPGNPPGAGQFPAGNFWIRRTSITLVNGKPTDFALIGHWSSTGLGDWVSPVITGAAPIGTMDFSEDAAPYFTAGDYFDSHCNCDSATEVYVTIWYVPAN